jgi:hypothetical protein
MKSEERAPGRALVAAATSAARLAAQAAPNSGATDPNIESPMRRAVTPEGRSPSSSSAAPGVGSRNVVT